MPSSTKWRLNITAGIDLAFVSISKLQMRATAGGADQCSGGTASAQTEYSGSYVAANAFDADASSRWLNNGVTSVQWLQYEFASAVSVAEYTIRGYEGGGYEPKSWALEYWDGAAWVSADTRTNETGWTAGQTRTYTVTVSEPPPIRVTQLLAELVLPIPGAPIATTQVAIEQLNIEPAPNEARVTQLACELIIIPFVPPLVCPDDFPIDDDDGGGTCAVDFPT